MAITVSRDVYIYTHDLIDETGNLVTSYVHLLSVEIKFLFRSCTYTFDGPWKRGGGTRRAQTL